MDVVEEEADPAPQPKEEVAVTTAAPVADDETVKEEVVEVTAAAP